MEPNAEQPKAPESKPGSKPNGKDDLKSLPIPVLQEKLGSSPDGLSQAEAQKRLTQYGPNEIEEKKTDCGIAVSGATDAARAAASIVLMTPGLSVIIDAIKESPPNEPTRTAWRALPKE